MTVVSLGYLDHKQEQRSERGQDDERLDEVF